jgi:hypothetical protein
VNKSKKIACLYFEILRNRFRRTEGGRGGRWLKCLDGIENQGKNGYLQVLGSGKTGISPFTWCKKAFP